MDKEYIPYGPEWQKEMNNFSKKELIKMLGDALSTQTTFNQEESIYDSGHKKGWEEAKAYFKHNPEDSVVRNSRTTDEDEIQRTIQAIRDHGEKVRSMPKEWIKQYCAALIGDAEFPEFPKQEVSFKMEHPQPKDQVEQDEDYKNLYLQADERATRLEKQLVDLKLSSTPQQGEIKSPEEIRKESMAAFKKTFPPPVVADAWHIWKRAYEAGLNASQFKNQSPERVWSDEDMEEAFEQGMDHQNLPWEYYDFKTWFSNYKQQKSKHE